MTYEHLIEKMLKEQEKFMPTIDALEEQGSLPKELARAAANIKVWDQAANIPLGKAEVPEETPDINVVNAFSNALFTYHGMFDEQERKAIELYREYADELFNMVKGANIKPA